ncbi:L-aspartate oxidase [Roseiterribacter gracilis]|uniref:L-aspartate oxidase n=1 Tax=Roseiterribacter gracilis TaxID=2812848 RepID=A0A8S8XA68_9PROT|nr:L-aspartate oxidase [Rhodospirillales bacterium TMPK1]
MNPDLRADLVVVGAGIAGLTAALEAAPRRVLLLASSPLTEGASSAWAQGGIAAAIGTDDSVAEHLADTRAAGAGLVDDDAAQAVLARAPAAIAALVARGVVFDKDADGSLSLGREAAHGRRRIAHVAGDSTGLAVTRALADAVRQAPHIELLQAAARALLVENGRVVGVLVEQSGRSIAIAAGGVLLATGGIGQLYDRTTNPLDARGDGLALAARAGAELVDLEFVQFHPTAIDVDANPRPLATEALRGEGATLIDADGHRFMPAIDPAAELAPRDVVARAIFAQQRAFLDARAIGDRFPERFPTVFKLCAAHGIDPRVTPIPVAPAAHYHMGGIAADARGRTSLSGLWAAGEVASTGMHGANRLASNSLLEALVAGGIAAADMCASSGPAPLSLPDAPRLIDPLRDAARIEALRTLMFSLVGVVRDATGLTAARKAFAAQMDAPGELGRRATVSYLLATAALAREESRGGHFRSDFPVSKEESRTRIRWTLATACAREREAA